MEEVKEYIRRPDSPEVHGEKPHLIHSQQSGRSPNIIFNVDEGLYDQIHSEIRNIVLDI
jgi:hypothetical protein